MPTCYLFVVQGILRRILMGAKTTNLQVLYLGSSVRIQKLHQTRKIGQKLLVVVLKLSAQLPVLSYVYTNILRTTFEWNAWNRLIDAICIVRDACTKSSTYRPIKLERVTRSLPDWLNDISYEVFRCLTPINPTLELGDTPPRVVCHPRLALTRNYLWDESK